MNLLMEVRKLLRGRLINQRNGRLNWYGNFAHSVAIAVAIIGGVAAKAYAGLVMYVLEGGIYEARVRVMDVRIWMLFVALAALVAMALLVIFDWSMSDSKLSFLALSGLSLVSIVIAMISVASVDWELFRSLWPRDEVDGLPSFIHSRAWHLATGDDIMKMILQPVTQWHYYNNASRLFSNIAILLAICRFPVAWWSERRSFKASHG